jgi:multisubunit Na+/H+ antiporter MnhG subunit
MYLVLSVEVARSPDFLTQYMAVDIQKTIGSSNFLVGLHLTFLNWNGQKYSRP